jgi:hypothetical protein
MLTRRQLTHIDCLLTNSYFHNMSDYLFEKLAFPLTVTVECFPVI